MRRDKEDIKWQEVKKKVRQLDHNRCCLCSCLTVKELEERKKSNYCYQSFSIIDPAHYKAVSLDPKHMYDENNIYCLCRSCHESLDHMYSPINGKPIKLEEIEAYWKRIIDTRKQTSDLLNLPELFDNF